MAHGHKLKGGGECGWKGVCRVEGNKGGKWDNYNSVVNKIHIFYKGNFLYSKLRSMWEEEEEKQGPVNHLEISYPPTPIPGSPSSIPSFLQCHTRGPLPSPLAKEASIGPADKRAQ